MYDPVWEAVGRLELCSFKVLALVCDGLAANRKLFRLHNPDLGSDDILHKIPNPYSDDGRELFFISDPPHLIKTVRNAWYNSKRHLWVCFRLYFCGPYFILTMVHLLDLNSTMVLWCVSTQHQFMLFICLVQWEGYIMVSLSEAVPS